MDTSLGTTNPVARYAPTEYVLPTSYTCEFTEFKAILVNLRKTNDNFKFILNKINSPSQCGEIWNQISTVMSFRRAAINSCINKTNEELRNYQAQPPTTTVPSTPSYNQLDRQLKNKIDLLKEELDIEDILWRQTEKLYRRACPSYPLPVPSETQQLPSF